MTDKRHDGGSTEQDDQAGNAQQNKRSCEQPVAKSLDSLEAQHLASSYLSINLDPSTHQEEQGEQGQCCEQQITSVGAQGAGAQVKPSHAGVLNKNGGGKAT